MFVIDRRLAQTLRAVLRRGSDETPARADRLPVVFRQGTHGLLVTACTEEFAMACTVPGPVGEGVFACAAGALAAFEGRTDDPVELAPGPETIRARWIDNGIPQQHDLLALAVDGLPVMPAGPKQFTPMPAALLPALHEASISTIHTPNKYALNRIQLKGRAGQVIGSDSRQLLVQGGFTFPFTEDLLIPRSGLFNLPALLNESEVALGRTETHLALRVGNWSFTWLIDAKGRFPDAACLIPKPSAAKTRFELDPQDAEFFVRVLGRRLQTSDDLNLTLDLGESACFRFKRGTQVVEIALPRSRVDGAAVRVHVDVRQVLRAIEQRFAKFEVSGAGKPYLARADDRLFLAMPLNESLCVLPHADAVRMSPLDQALVPVRKKVARMLPAERPVVTTSTEVTPVTSVVVGTSPIESDEPFDVFNEATALADAVARAALHAGRVLGYLRGLYRQPQVSQFVRQSFHSLTDRIARSNP